MPSFTAADGVRIAYQDWPGSAAALPPVVLHHGFASSGDGNWVGTGVGPALRAAGRRVVAIDARGHGASDKPHDAASYGEGRMADDLGALIDLVGGPVDLVGYSMGAIVALLTATGRGDLRRLVVGGIGAGVVELGGVDTRVMNSGGLAAALRAPGAGSVADPVARGFRLFAAANGNDLLALAAQAEAVHRERIPLERISAPTLVLAGTEDALASHPERLAAAIPGARLVQVPGDHLSAVVAPEFLSALLDFLAAPTP